MFFCLFFKNPLLSAGRMRFSKKQPQKNKKIGPILTLKRANIGPVLTLQHIYICIYGWVAICRRNFCHFFVFPKFYSKKWPKKMLQICPVSVRSRSIEMTQNWFEVAIPSFFFKRDDWDNHLKLFLFWFIWVFMLKLVPKPLLNHKNIKHVKFYLSKTTLKIATANGPTSYWTCGNSLPCPLLPCTWLFRYRNRRFPWKTIVNEEKKDKRGNGKTELEPHASVQPHANWIQ